MFKRSRFLFALFTAAAVSGLGAFTVPRIVTATSSPLGSDTPIGEVLYSPAVTPASTIALGPQYAVETAQRITVNCTGTIAKLWWYRVADDTGLNTATIWRNGAILGRANGTPNGTGWVSLVLPAPVTVSPGDQLLVSIHHPNGAYGYNLNGFQNRKITSPNGCLTIPTSTPTAANGLYGYTATPTLPTLNYLSSEYFITPELSTTQATQLTPTLPIGEVLYAPTVAPASSIALGPEYAVETGQRITVNCTGTIAKLWWYRVADDTGLNTATIWRNGAILGQVNGAPNRAGWVPLVFPAPVSVNPGDQLLVSIHHPNGAYGYNLNGLQSRTITSPNGCLTLPASTPDAPNGLYDYTATPTLPTLTYLNSEYFITPELLTTQTAPPPPPAPTTTTVTTVVPATTVAPATTLVATTLAPATTVSPATTSTPTTATPSTTTPPPVTRTTPATTAPPTTTRPVTTTTPATTTTPPTTATTTPPTTTSSPPPTTVPPTPGPTGEVFYAPSVVPASTIASGSQYAVETGQRVTINCTGTIRHIWWYRTAADTGRNTATIWRNGIILGRANDSRTQTGWVSLELTIPVSVNPGDQLLVSIHHPNGAYAYSHDGFKNRAVTTATGCMTIAASTTNAPNGVYHYSANPILPSMSHRDSEYFITPELLTVPGTRPTATTTTITPATTTTSTTSTPTTRPTSTTTSPASPVPTIPAPNPINSNWQIAGTSGWNAANAAYDATESRSAGSGSFRFGAQYTSIISAPVLVTPGVPYTLSAFIKSADWPSGNISIVPVEMSLTTGYVRQLPGFIFAAPGSPNTWQEVATVVVPPPSVRYIAFSAMRAEKQFSASNLWLDDITIAPGVQTRAPMSPRVAFSGSQTRVDALGNWEVLENGIWKPWFPLCVAGNSGRADFATLAAGGFNCDIWHGHDVYGAQKAKSAGMRSFFQLAQYYQPTGWAYKNMTDLESKIRAINASSVADYVAGYWMDNEEPWGNFEDYERTARTVQAVDRLNGVRRRPIVQLMNSPYSRAFSRDQSDFSDVLGGYTPPASGYAAAGNTGNRLLSSTLEAQRQPVSLCQLGQSGRDFRSTLYGCLAHGGRSMSYWMDGDGKPIPNAPEYTILPVDQQPFWSELPTIRREIDAMMPVIRAPESTTWKIRNSTGNAVYPIAASTREVNGVAHMILANMTSGAISTTFQVDAGAYAVGEVRDYFTNQLVATANNGSFTLTMAAADLQTGTRVLKLMAR